MPIMEAPTRSSEILKSIKSMFVLYGSVRSTSLARRIDRSLMDLPLVSGTISSHQLSNARACARRFQLSSFEMRMLVETESPRPKDLAGFDEVSYVVQQDASPIRGVAGVLSDATKDMGDDEYIIVTSGAQIFLEPLDDLVHAMAKKCADISFVSSVDGAPVGVWLIRCGTLKTIKPIGYVDLKEQALEEWKSSFKVSVVERRRAYAHPARSLVEYLSAVRAEAAGFGSGTTIDEDPYREDWESTFSIVEPGAKLAEGAILHDSTMLSGSTVGKGAVVVRSVICPGAVVEPGARVTDKVLTGVAKKERVR